MYFPTVKDTGCLLQCVCKRTKKFDNKDDKDLVMIATTPKPISNIGVDFILKITVLEADITYSEDSHVYFVLALEDEIYKSKSIKPRSAWNEKIQMVFSDWPPADKLFIKLWKRQTLRHDMPLGEAELDLCNLLQESGSIDERLDIYRLNRLKNGKIHIQVNITPLQINQTGPLSLPPLPNNKSLTKKK